MEQETLKPCQKCGSYKRIGINPDFEYWCKECGTRFRKIDGVWKIILRGKEQSQ